MNADNTFIPGAKKRFNLHQLKGGNRMKMAHLLK